MSIYQSDEGAGDFLVGTLGTDLQVVYFFGKEAILPYPEQACDAMEAGARSTDNVPTNIISGNDLLSLGYLSYC